MSTNPLISVLLPVHNGEPFVRAAIESVLAQSLTDFELLVIDDGSTDRTRECVSGLDDSRIRLLFNEHRQGLPATLDRGLALARGRYLARMDADDLCMADRFRLQVAHLEQNPRVTLVGSWYRLIGSGREVQLPVSHEEIVFHLMRYNCIAHPTVMIRIADLQGKDLSFEAGYEYAEDFAYWVRMARLGLKFYNLPQPLLLHRRHTGQISRAHAQEQRSTSERIVLEQLAHIGLVPAPEEVCTHFSILRGEFRPDAEYVEAAARWIEALLAANRVSDYYDNAVMAAFFAEKWFRINYQATAIGLAAWRRYRNATFARSFRPAPLELLKLAARACLGLGTNPRAA